MEALSTRALLQRVVRLRELEERLALRAVNETAFEATVIWRTECLLQRSRDLTRRYTCQISARRMCRHRRQTATRQHAA